jgi:preprotein translocase subunit SecG
MKDLKILISTILIIISFFLWYLYSERKHSLDKKDSKHRQVNIEIMKTKLKITKNSQDVEIYVNWEKNETWSIDIVKN